MIFFFKAGIMGCLHTYFNVTDENVFEIAFRALGAFFRILWLCKKSTLWIFYHHFTASSPMLLILGLFLLHILIQFWSSWFLSSLLNLPFAFHNSDMTNGSTMLAVIFCALLNHDLYFFSSASSATGSSRCKPSRSSLIVGLGTIILPNPRYITIFPMHPLSLGAVVNDSVAVIIF